MEENSEEILLGFHLKMKEELWALIHENIINGEPGECRVSEYTYATQWTHIEPLCREVLDMVKPDMPVDDAMEMLEGFWSNWVAKGQFDILTKEVEEI